MNARISTKYEFICEYVQSIGKFILGLLSLSHDALLFGILFFNFRFQLFLFFLLFFLFRFIFPISENLAHQKGGQTLNSKVRPPRIS